MAGIGNLAGCGIRLFTIGSTHDVWTLWTHWGLANQQLILVHSECQNQPKQFVNQHYFAPAAVAALHGTYGLASHRMQWAGYVYTDTPETDLPSDATGGLCTAMPDVAAGATSDAGGWL